MHRLPTKDVHVPVDEIRVAIINSRFHWNVKNRKKTEIMNSYINDGKQIEWMFCSKYTAKLTPLIWYLLLQENQRPPVYNAEDYILSLKKFGRRTSGTTNGEPKSIYDTSEEKNSNSKAATLPAKHSAFKYVFSGICRSQMNIDQNDHKFSPILSIGIQFRHFPMKNVKCL